jgi:predicted nucleic acid-binding protein
VKSFFDTSVLVPVFFDEHVHHEASLALFSKASSKNSGCAAHTLAEVYSTVMRMPSQYRIAAEEAMLLLDSLNERLSFVTLDLREYWSTLKRCSELGMAGGGIYDALIARCAMKAGAETIYTWNLSHFTRLGTEIAARVRTP